MRAWVLQAKRSSASRGWLAGWADIMTWHGATGKRGTNYTAVARARFYIPNICRRVITDVEATFLLFSALLCFRWFFYSSYFLAQSRRDDKIIRVVWCGGWSYYELELSVE
ncbi:hypothetical protein NEUTE1DRAFT_116707 [Neurospora tetrasperma FGSC 2508]|uniref:Uncharacterized protein n=1 Tax=Neurospora tetrasperma (strain FGSC 2508 / ATCC MYA-4615 / P0657) TaxID=510951 RepID=F8MJ99_NEUT8|nr:uncharacterized protein NEUTE1DRAFT_116707 [Neurospora tetrasperma FGSC 2508]EGO59943.1 hypothetical protein NEUTE1DRAFT_116707 [Neurospora tetrasperma FGSC 2508]EGZ74093.1 hypothetical protein NEUTE2DRAFT_144400 [Neurospora tetrasperma FGSC 2509]